MKKEFKTEFELESISKKRTGIIEIIGAKGAYPYVRIEMYNGSAIGTIKDSELELFALNILKALKSKHLQSK